MYAQQQLDLLVTEVMESKEEARKAVSAQVPMQSAPTTLSAQRIRAVIELETHIPPLAPSVFQSIYSSTPLCFSTH